MRIGLVGFLALFAVALLFTAYRIAWSEELTQVVFVKDGERVCSSNNTCKFLEYSADETFENTDEWAFFKWNSSDVHREIRAGLTCDKVLVAGWRVPFMSWYRNIIWTEGCR